MRFSLESSLELPITQELEEKFKGSLNFEKFILIKKPQNLHSFSQNIPFPYKITKFEHELNKSSKLLLFWPNGAELSTKIY